MHDRAGIDASDNVETARSFHRPASSAIVHHKDVLTVYSSLTKTALSVAETDREPVLAGGEEVVRAAEQDVVPLVDVLLARLVPATRTCRRHVTVVRRLLAPGHRRLAAQLHGDRRRTQRRGEHLRQRIRHRICMG